MLLLRPIGVAPIDAIIFALLKVNPIDPDVVFVSIVDIIIQVKNVVTCKENLFIFVEFYLSLKIIVRKRSFSLTIKLDLL